MTSDSVRPSEGDEDSGPGLARAYEIAYAYINRRERTTHEVQTQLLRKGVSSSAAARVLDELVATRLVDDERFVRLFVADKRELERWGRERIVRGLIARGIDRSEAVAGVDGGAGDRAGPGPGRGLGPDGGPGHDRGPGHEGGPGHDGGLHMEPELEPESELDRALDVLRRRFPLPPADRRERERALGVLLRKGYESELALDALAAYARGED